MGRHALHPACQRVSGARPGIGRMESLTQPHTERNGHGQQTDAISCRFGNGARNRAIRAHQRIAQAPSRHHRRVHSNARTRFKNIKHSNQRRTHKHPALARCDRCQPSQHASRALINSIIESIKRPSRRNRSSGDLPPGAPVHRLATATTVSTTPDGCARSMRRDSSRAPPCDKTHSYCKYRTHFMRCKAPSRHRRQISRTDRKNPARIQTMCGVHTATPSDSHALWAFAGPRKLAGSASPGFG